MTATRSEQLTRTSQCLFFNESFLGKCKIKGSKIVNFDGMDLKLKVRKLIKLVNADNFGVDLETLFCGNGSVCLKAVTLNLGIHSVNINYNLNTQQVKI